MTVFISYSRRDKDAVNKLTQELQDAQEQVWMDQRLAGGDAWWRAILEQIRSCDVFIFALSQNSIQSKPCQAELHYAQALGLPILPVQVGPVDSMQLNPLATVQTIDYRTPTPSTAMQLISALNRTKAQRQPLPSSLPDEPEVPFEYLIRLYTTIAGPDQLSPRDQAALVAQLQVGLREDGDHDAARNDIVVLLTKLRDREDVSYRTRTDVEAILASIDSRSATSSTSEASPALPTSAPEPTHLDDVGPTTPAPAAEQQPADPNVAATSLRPQVPPQREEASPRRVTGMPPRATLSKRKWLIAGLVVLVIAAAGGTVVLRHVLSSKATGGELMLTGATDPGVNPFMPPAASAPPTDTQPPPTLQPRGDGTSVVTQPLPGGRDGLYGGILDNAESDRDKMIAFLGSHPAQAGAFVEALNSDPSLYWSGAHPLTTADIPAYLRELTPGLLRLDTRATNHGFNGTHPTPLQSVLQAGTAVLVDAHGVPRARPYSGNPLTAPVALAGQPKPVGTPWPGYHPGALAAIQPSTATITTFVLVDVVTGHPFNRPAGTAGTNDTPHTGLVPPPGPATSAPTAGQGPQSDIAGVYMRHTVTWECNGLNAASADAPLSVSLQGNTVTIWGQSGPLSADGSFVAEGPWGPYDHSTVKGVFATEGGHWVIRDGTWDDRFCHGVWTATKQ